VEVELKPSMLVRKLLLYIICEYIKASKQAAEVLLCTVPGMCVLGECECALILTLIVSYPKVYFIHEDQTDSRRYGYICTVYAC
jgi:hypothetical protein